MYTKICVNGLETLCNYHVDIDFAQRKLNSILNGQPCPKLMRKVNKHSGGIFLYLNALASRRDSVVCKREKLLQDKSLVRIRQTFRLRFGPFLSEFEALHN